MRPPHWILRSLVVILIAALMAVPALPILSSATAGRVGLGSGPTASVPSTLSVQSLSRTPVAPFPYTELGRSAPGAVPE
ncbi:MAG: hypothetical protein L3K02_07955, partial [Thermoplasmata archaeon]|nr:hypothetical protein [Thermoplasmata archaeon]